MPHEAGTEIDGPVARQALSWRPAAGRLSSGVGARLRDMTTPSDASVTWAQALAWRLERHLLDPVGSDSVADVVRRLGAVLSMDESLAELAGRTRRRTSRSGELGRALADGTVIKAFAFRGSMHYISPEDGGIYLAL